MNPKDYQDYALSIDFFSNPIVNEGIDQFIKFAIRALPSSTSICDVGGGTGLVLNLILQKREDLSATLIEPADAMYYQAKALLSRRVTLIHDTLQGALPRLQPVHAFLFCRSLYSLSNKIEDYKTLFLKLASVLHPFGQIYIFDPSEIYDISSYKKRLEIKLKDQQNAFHRHWPVLERALERFNRGVTNGEFTLFSTEQLIATSQATGFELLYHRQPNLFCFRKKQ